MNALESNQSLLFNVDTKEINPYWIDPAQPLQVPVNPLHFYAHKLQLLLARMDKQSEKNPAQFNSANYLSALKNFTEVCEGINKGKTNIDEVLGSGDLGESGDERTTPAMGSGTASGVDSGISPDNPLAR